MKSNKKNELVSILKGLRESIAGQPGAALAPTSAVSPENTEKPALPKKKVIFDKSTGAPFEATFTERGFLIEDTRLSFEDIETAISKNYNIVLNGGKGLVLDAVKMQKILKYKEIK